MCAPAPLCAASLRPSNQIEQREKKQPDDIHEMPVKTGIFNRREMPFGISSLARQYRQHPQKPDSHDHVQRVQSRHKKIETHKHLNALPSRALQLLSSGTES